MMDETRPIELTQYEASLLWYHMGDEALEPVRALSRVDDPAVRDMGDTWQRIRAKVETAWGPFYAV